MVPLDAGSDWTESLVDESHLSGRRTHLEHLSQTRLPWLERVINDHAVIGRWRTAGIHLTPDRMTEFIWKFADVQFVGVQTSTALPLGLVQLFDISWRDRHGSLSVLIAPEYQLSGWSLEFVFLAILYAKERLGLDRLFLQVPGYNLEQFRSAAERVLALQVATTGSIRRGDSTYSSETYEIDLHSAQVNLLRRIARRPTVDQL